MGKFVGSMWRFFLYDIKTSW